MPNWFEGAEQEGSDYSGTISVEFRDGDYRRQAVVTTILDDPITKKDGTLRMDLPSFYKLPESWAIKDGRIIHDSGDLDKVLPKTNQWQQFVAAAGACGGAAMAYLTRDGLNPYTEQAWEGARFHLHQLPGKKFESFTNDKGEVVPAGESRGIIVPTEWLGTKDAPIGGSVGATVSSSVDAATVIGEVGLDSDTFDALTGLALNETPDKFVTDAMAHREGASNAQAFIKHLGSGALYAALREE